MLSVALFAVAINDIGDELPTAVGRSLFVDDLAVWCSASGVRHVSRQLQLAVARLERWTAENGLQFSVSKTTAVHFCRRRCINPDLGIRLYGQTIPTQPVARFLGVWFDRRLSYQEHFKTLRERCFRSLNVLKCVSRTSYGADRKTLLVLYRSIIRSKLDYASFVYDGASESSKRVLDTVHHASLRVVTGAFRTSPAPSLLAEVHEPPLSLRRQMLGMRYALKIRQFPSHPTYPYIFSHQFLSISGSVTRKLPPFGARMQSMFERSGISIREVMRIDDMQKPPWQCVQPRIDLSLAEIRKGDLLPIESRSRAAQLLTNYEGHTLIFTDGSKTVSGVGCAFVCGLDTRSFSLPAHSSVFTSELVAIHKALCFAEVSSDESYLILSDSLSSLLALKSFYPRCPLLQDILVRITSLNEAGKSLRFCWVPSRGAKFSEK